MNNPAIDTEVLPPSIGGMRVRAQVRLGRSSVPLGRLFDLAAGSVIEMEQPMAQPAEIVVNGVVVASGRIVVSNGHYAVAITSRGPGIRGG